MPAVPIILTSWGPTRADVMGVQVDGEPVVSMVTTPPRVHGTPGTWGLTVQDRPGMQALTMPTAPGLRTASFDHWVQHPDPNGDVEALLHPFRGIAEKGRRVQFLGGGWLLSGTWWWVENLSVEELEKGRGGVTSRAKLVWSLKEANLVDAVTLTRTGVKKGVVTVVKGG